jgi:tRNA pseudouridine55 synthase
MKNVINVFKPLGVTPLDMVKKVREKFPWLQEKKIGYAGRLDPMAQGVLILLIEPETKNRDQYQNLDKEYEFEVLFGVETDTYDVLGKHMSRSNSKSKIFITKQSIEDTSSNFLGKQDQQYPPFSSKTVNGKPLHWWAKEGKMDKIEIPSKKITVHSIKLLKIFSIDIQTLGKKVFNRISLVKGDFRQSEIKKNWVKFIENNPNVSLPVGKFKILCSSGTYVRSIAHGFGEETGTGAIAFDILRTRVGPYCIKNSLYINGEK